MSQTTVVTARLDAETLRALDHLAGVQDRTRAALIERAIKRFVGEERAFEAFLQEGKDAIERGEFLTHEAFVAEIARWKQSRKSAA
jgi:predicted transcriptional regulator